MVLELVSANCRLLAATFQRSKNASTPEGCLILALFTPGITRELVHQHRSLPSATLCLSAGLVQVADARYEVILMCLSGLLAREALSLSKVTSACTWFMSEWSREAAGRSTSARQAGNIGDSQLPGSAFGFLGSLWMAGHSLIVSASHLLSLRRLLVRTSAGSKWSESTCRSRKAIETVFSSVLL
jgi:hypothetical protein